MSSTLRTAFLAGLASICTVALCVITYAAVSTLSQAEEPLFGSRDDGSVSDDGEFFDIAWLSRLAINPFRERMHRLVAVVIENHEGARPHQEGLRDALMVQEWMVEGLISRFIALYDIDRLPPRIGPVRSLRPYFVDGTRSWITHYVHAGGSPEALERVDQTEATSINALKSVHHDYFTRANGIPAPHDLFIERAEALAMLADAEIPNVPWPPYDKTSPASTSGASVISINYYNRLHNVTYEYDAERKTYARSNGLIDNQAFPRNVLVVELPIEGVGEYGRLNIPVRSPASAVLFRDGEVYRGTWSMDVDAGRIVFVDDESEPVGFANGQLWITVVPDISRVSWER